MEGQVRWLHTFKAPVTKSDAECQKEGPITHRLLITAAIVGIAFAPSIGTGTAHARGSGGGFGGFHGGGFGDGFHGGGFGGRGFMAGTAAVFTAGMVAAFTAGMVASIRVIMVTAIPVLLLLLLTRDSWGPNGAALALIKARHFSLLQAWPGYLGAAMPANREAAFR
jgi:hypothetical protein